MGRWDRREATVFMPRKSFLIMLGFAGVIGGFMGIIIKEISLSFTGC